jgi:CBS domain-containing protein
MRSGKIFICRKDLELIGIITKTDILNVEMEGQEVSWIIDRVGTAKKNASPTIKKTHQKLSNEGVSV